jgi:hypothetical protein
MNVTTMLPSAPSVDELTRELEAAKHKLSKTPPRHVHVRAQLAKEIDLLVKRVEYAAQGLDYLSILEAQRQRQRLRAILEYEIAQDLRDLVLEDLMTVTDLPTDSSRLREFAWNRWKDRLPRRLPQVLAAIARQAKGPPTYPTNAARWYHPLDLAEIERIRNLRAKRAQGRHVPRTRWEKTKELNRAEKVDIRAHRMQPTLRKLGIAYEEPIIDWHRSRYGSKPILGTPVIAGRDYVRYALYCLRRNLREQKRKPLPPDQLAQRSAARELQMPVAKYRKIANDPAAVQARRAQLAEQRQQARLRFVRGQVEAHARRLGYPVEELAEQEKVLQCFPDAWVCCCCEELGDLRQAHPAWLTHAVEAAMENRSRNGRLSAWYRNGEIEFHEYLCGCLEVQHRHEGTDYDDLLAEGYDREMARMLAQRHG